MPADAVSASSIAAPAAPGFYGKLPARGDFVGRRLARSFVEAWDGWLQQAILASREALGARWLEIYLTSPLWRFALAAGACGPTAVAGVLMPSVDSVGRYFPLMLGRELAADLDVPGFIQGAGAWYDALETLALSALSDGFDLASFDQPIPQAIPIARSDRAAAAPDGALEPPGRHCALDGVADLARLGREHAAAPAPPQTLWWTSGSERVEPSFLACPGLPLPAAFPSLLDGDWSSRSWHNVGRPGAAAGSEPGWDREE